jgi:hypothetical protein
VNIVIFLNKNITLPRLKSLNFVYYKLLKYKHMKKYTKQSLKNSISKELNDTKGYPIYPAEEDIYKKYVEEKEIDPEEISKNKKPIEIDKIDKSNRKDIVDDESGRDLDIPGSELDDEQEDIGSEDEENNFYSLGGDDHNNLDENNGE